MQLDDNKDLPLKQISPATLRKLVIFFPSMKFPFTHYYYYCSLVNIKKETSGSVGVQMKYLITNRNHRRGVSLSSCLSKDERLEVTQK